MKPRGKQKRIPYLFKEFKPKWTLLLIENIDVLALVKLKITHGIIVENKAIQMFRYLLFPNLVRAFHLRRLIFVIV